jgi:general secretion pathway protein C
MNAFKLFLVAFLSIGVIISFLGFFLPKTPIFYSPLILKEDFIQINLNKIFQSNTILPTTQNAPTLKWLTLKAIYNTTDGGFIIVEKNKKSIFLNINDSIDGYKLIKILPTKAIFQKGNKTFILEFKKTKSKTFYNQSTTYTTQISKNTIKEYKKDLTKIWNNIAIARIRGGYKITYIKKGSIFEKIGLKKGDIITHINGTRLTNDAKAWHIYNNIEKYQNLTITIKRGNQTKVIEYEIY